MALHERDDRWTHLMPTSYDFENRSASMTDTLANDELWADTDAPSAEAEWQRLNRSMSSSTTVNRSYVGSPPTNIAPCRAGGDISLSSLGSSKAVKDDTTPNKPESYLPRSMVKRSWWLFELLASALSMLGLGALVAVLLYYDGKPQTAWTPRIFALNGLVAALATVTRAALMVPVVEALSQEKWSWCSPPSQSRERKLRGRELRDLNVFDGASRGAFGSLKFLWLTRGL